MDNESKELKEKLTSIEGLLQSQLVIELFKLGVSQNEIGKRLKLRTATVNSLLKGIKKEK